MEAKEKDGEAEEKKDEWNAKEGWTSCRLPRTFAFAGIDFSTDKTQ